MQSGASTTRYSALLRRDALCDDFEAEWRAGRRPSLEDYLTRVSAGRERLGLVRELLEIELHYRRGLGESANPQDYAARLPEWAHVLEHAWTSDPPDSHWSGQGSDPRSPDKLPTWIGKYRVVEWLGSGGQADVYRAVHPELGHEVAIKWSRSRLPSDAEWGPLREGKVLAELNHAGLTKAYDLDVCDGRPFLVLEYVPGVNLEQYARARQVSVRRACAIVAELAEAAAFAHARGVVHHDIKPGNVLVQSDGEVRLIDFGLARVELAWQAGAERGRVAGTPAYMAPEQARGEGADERADVFGLGAVLHFLLVGHGPFDAPSSDESLAKAIAGTWDEKALSQAAAPRRLLRLVRRALEPNVELRIQTAGELADALSRRRPLIRRTALAFGLLAAVGFAAWATWPTTSPPNGANVVSVPPVPTQLPYGTEPGLGHDIAAGLDVRDLVLVMTFDRGTFVEREEGKYFRDLSNRGLHGKAIDITYAEGGKYGQALRMGKGGIEVPAALLDLRTEYTLACWLYFVSQPHGGVFYSEFLTQGWDRGDTCFFSVSEDGRVGVAAWNIRHPKLWLHQTTPPGVVPERQWCFVAITLRYGGVDQGELTVQVDDQRFVLPSQQIRSNPPNFPARTSVVGANSALDRGFPGMLDHLWIFTRALSQEEINLLRETGRPARREQP